MNRKKLLSLLLFGLSFVIAHAQPTTPITIDVRTEQEFNQEHIQGAVLAPHNNIENLIASISTDKAQPIILYCKSGRRAGIAKEKLLSLGYRHVTNAGGIEDIKEQHQATLSKE